MTNLLSLEKKVGKETLIIYHVNGLQTFTEI